MSEAAALPFATLILGLTISVVGWLIIRAVQAVDAQVSGVAAKVDSLVARDTAFEVALTDLRARIVGVEARLADMEQAFKRGL